MNPKRIRQQFADTMLSVGQEDQDLVVLIGDISHFILQPFAKACPDRFYNVGICEPTIISMAAGLAAVGLHPVAHTIAPFLIERSFEQIKIDLCYQELGANIVTVGSAFDYANLGCTHHCYGDFALLKTLPRTQIVYPASAPEFDRLFRQAYRSGKVTVYRIPEAQHGVDFSEDTVVFGKGVRVREGTNLTIVVTGPQLRNVIEATRALIAGGWEPEVLYIHTVRPLDADLIRTSVGKTRRVLVVEEHMQAGGLGDDVLREIQGIGPVEFVSLSIPNDFVHDYGHYEDHCRKLGLTPEGIVSIVDSRWGKGTA